jgi:hypothetical protein
VETPDLGRGCPDWPTVKRYHYDSHEQFEAHLADFVSAYNFGRRLHQMPGLNLSSSVLHDHPDPGPSR